MDESRLDRLISELSRDEIAAAVPTPAELILAAVARLRDFSLAVEGHSAAEFAARLIALATAAGESETVEAVRREAGDDPAKLVAAELYGLASQGEVAQLTATTLRLNDTVSDRDGRLAGSVFGWLPTTVLTLAGVEEPQHTQPLEGGSGEDLEQILAKLGGRAKDILKIMYREGITVERRAWSQDAIAAEVQKGFTRNSIAKPFANLQKFGLVRTTGPGAGGGTFLTPLGVQVAELVAGKSRGRPSVSP